MSLHHVIVGTGIAALSAAEAIRGADPKARITMVGAEREPFYSRPGLAYLLTGETPESLLTLRSPETIGALRMERLVARAMRLAPNRKLLGLDDGSSLAFDRLLIATGAASIPADFPGATLPGVLQLDDLTDARALIRHAQAASAAVVIGGGSTALELVDGLQARGLATHYCMRGDRFWSKVFDRVESAIVEARLLSNGVTLHRHTAIREAIESRGVLAGVRTDAGTDVPCDILAVAIGVRPRIALALAGGLATERGILTNEFLETSAPQIYAAGDVAQIFDPVTRTAQLDTIWASALQQGRSAGLNMSGLRVAHRKHAPINVTRVGGITVTIIGSVGSGADPDLLTLTRGQSERWVTDPDAWSVTGARHGDRLRVVVSGRTIVGAVVMGDQRLSKPLAHLIGEQVNISELRPALDAAPDDAMDLLLAFCDAHVRDHAAPHR